MPYRIPIPTWELNPDLERYAITPTECVQLSDHLGRGRFQHPMEPVGIVEPGGSQTEVHSSEARMLPVGAEIVVLEVDTPEVALDQAAHYAKKWMREVTVLDARTIGDQGQDAAHAIWFANPPYFSACPGQCVFGFFGPGSLAISDLPGMRYVDGFRHGAHKIAWTEVGTDLSVVPSRGSFFIKAFNSMTAALDHAAYMSVRAGGTWIVAELDVWRHEEPYK